MYQQVLTFVAERGQARVTEIQQAFGLSAEMAACLCIELQDAQWLTDTPPSACPRQGGDGGCGSCAQSACPGHTSPGDPSAFEGCCGINAPFRLTTRGRTFLGQG